MDVNVCHCKDSLICNCYIKIIPKKKDDKKKVKSHINNYPEITSGYGCDNA